MNKRSRVFGYTQQLSYLKQKLDDFPRLLGESGADQWAYIVHDKDTTADGVSKEAHVHVVLKFENARTLQSVSKIFKDSPQYVELPKTANGYNNMLAYLTHRTKSATTKYQYEPEAIIANFDYPDVLNKITAKVNQRDSKTRLDDILERLMAYEITYNEAVSELTASEFSRYHQRLKVTAEYGRRQYAKRWIEQREKDGTPIEVIWIWGEAGSGKTVKAKKIARERSTKGFYMATGLRDPFQGYTDEPVIILDDLRPKTFDYNELLQILDPFNGTMADSRYSNKTLIADTIIVTSVYSPKDFYNMLVPIYERDIETYEQLSRRICKIVQNGNKTPEKNFFQKNGIVSK